MCSFDLIRIQNVWVIIHMFESIYIFETTIVFRVEVWILPLPSGHLPNEENEILQR